MDPREFRHTLGQFATGITVVTTADGDQVHGMTANAFTSVSLDPPLVLVSVDRRARAHEAIPRAGQFGISFLLDDQEPVSTHFAGRPQPEVAETLTFAWHEGVPVLERCLAYLTCRVWAQYDGGDHTLYVGEVLKHEVHGGHSILFWQGKYHHIA